MKHCRRCNLDYPTDYRFCAACGGTLAERDARSDAPPLCGTCGATLRPDWAFCGLCSAPVARTAARPAPQRTAAAPAYAAPSLTACPSCRRPMEEGGGFCEHCGARVNEPARPPLDTTPFQPPEPGVAESFREDRASGYAPDAMTVLNHDNGGPAAVVVDHTAETITHDEETRDEETHDEEADAPDPVKEHEGAADEDVTADAVAAQADEVAGEYEEDAPAGANSSDGIPDAAPQPSPYGEPRSFAYGEPLPTFGFEETAESAETPARGSGPKWLTVGGVGLAALVLVFVAAAVVFRGSSPTPTEQTAPETRADSTAGNAPAQSQPAPPEGMVYVPGGKFMMGRDGGDDYERPRHEVTVGPFFIDKYEVTREEYQKYVAATGRAPRGWVGGKFPEGTGRLPVTGVNWADAVAYAQWANKRLPTEAEWEFAARGDDGRVYPWGNEWQGGLANADNSTRKALAPVGEHKGASPFGLFDAVGNAWEWTSSALQAYPGGRLPRQDGRDLRVIRGGSWQSDRSAATTTYRWGWPAEAAEDYSNTSFRCVRDVAAAGK